MLVEEWCAVGSWQGLMVPPRHWAGGQQRAVQDMRGVRACMRTFGRKNGEACGEMASQKATGPAGICESERRARWDMRGPLPCTAACTQQGARSPLHGFSEIWARRAEGGKKRAVAKAVRTRDVHKTRLHSVEKRKRSKKGLLNAMASTLTNDPVCGLVFFVPLLSNTGPAAGQAATGAA